MTITINLSGMDLAAAGKEGITALVNACAAFAGASLGSEIEIPDAPHKTKSSETISVPEKVYVDGPIPAKPEQTTPAPTVAPAASETTVPAAPVTPTTPAPASVPPVPVPTADAPTYTIEELQLACAPLMDANRMSEIQSVIAKYGAASLLDIPKEQYGALAADLRALGAMHDFALIYRFKTVRMAIVQPRVGSISEFACTADELLHWGETVVNVKATEAMGKSPVFAPGEHCRFCRAKQQCMARCEHYDALESTERQKDPRLITLEDLGHYLSIADELKKWAEDLQEYALSECLAGSNVPGWKAVAGRGARSFTDTDKAFAILKKDGIDEFLLYKREPLTLAQIEKELGKKRFTELVGMMVVKTPGKPTLATESDKRPAVTNVPQATDVFQDLGTEGEKES